ncbi:MAG: hypothetical protein R2867_39105 [Caldilineaceae bacterium]
MNADLFGTKCLLNEEKALAALKYHHDLIYGAEPVAPPVGTMGTFGWSDVFFVWQDRVYGIAQLDGDQLHAPE